MSDWISATGNIEQSSSNTADASLTATAQTVVGNRNNLEVTGAGGNVRANTSTEYTVGQEGPSAPGVIATVQSHSGGAIFGRSPTGKDTVDVGGMRTSIDVAVGMGLLVRNGDGTFTDANTPAVLKDPAAEAKAKVEPKDAHKDEPAGVSFGGEADATMQELMAGQNPGDLFKTVDSILHNGNMDKGTVGRMAAMAGVEPHEMEAKVATVWQGAYESAMDVMAEGGVANEAGFEAFLAANPQKAADMREAARNYFVNHNVVGLETMAGEYLAKADKYDTAGMQELLDAAGWQHQVSPEGGLQVIVNGTPISWEVAVKQKVLTFSAA